MAVFTEIDIVPHVGSPDGITEIRKIYVVDEPHGGGGSGLVVADDFLTNGSGVGSCPNCLAASATSVDVFLNEPGEQGIKIPSGGYTYTGSGGISGLEANKHYTAYAR